MVSNKAVWVLIIISLLLLGASLMIANFSKNNSGKLNSEEIGGNQQGTIGLVVNSPAKPAAENG